MDIKKNEDAQEIAKKVVATAAKMKIVLTPEAYRVWYAYFEGQNEELSKEMDERLASGMAFTRELSVVLHNKYFGQKVETGMMDQVHRETQTIIKSVFDDLLKANKDTAQFGGKLGQYAQDVKGAGDISDIQQIIKALLADTTAMAANQRQMQEKLKEAHTQTEQLKSKLKKTEQEASVDGLTGLHNRRAFDRRLKELFAEFKSTRSYFSAIFVDIDFFKKFNDTYGHKVGDLVLQTVGGILHKGVKGSDFPARYGGEEFCILLPGTTLENAKIVAEQLRVLISVKKPKHPETGETYAKITASLGVSQIKPEDTEATVLERADQALYLAKATGRNNVKTERDLK